MSTGETTAWRTALFATSAPGLVDPRSIARRARSSPMLPNDTQFVTKGRDHGRRRYRAFFGHPLRLAYVSRVRMDAIKEKFGDVVRIKPLLLGFGDTDLAKSLRSRLHA
jgi:hypothetical protein